MGLLWLITVVLVFNLLLEIYNSIQFFLNHKIIFSYILKFLVVFNETKQLLYSRFMCYFSLLSFIHEFPFFWELRKLSEFFSSIQSNTRYVALLTPIQIGFPWFPVSFLAMIFARLLTILSLVQYPWYPVFAIIFYIKLRILQKKRFFKSPRTNCRKTLLSREFFM